MLSIVQQAIHCHSTEISLYRINASTEVGIINMYELHNVAAS